MALTLDDFKVLKAIGSNPEAFSAISSEVEKQARALVLKQLKAKVTDLENFKHIHSALGEQTFALIVDGMKDAEVKSVANRLDKLNPDVKAGNGAWMRQHLIALATCAALPIKKATKAISKTARHPIKLAQEKQPSLKQPGLSSRAMAAVRRRD